MLGFKLIHVSKRAPGYPWWMPMAHQQCVVVATYCAWYNLRRPPHGENLWYRVCSVNAYQAPFKNSIWHLIMTWLLSSGLNMHWSGSYWNRATSQIAKFMGPTWVPPGSCRPQVGPMLATWTLLSGMYFTEAHLHAPCILYIAYIPRNNQ